jgi:hypothetical protein
MNLSKRRLGSQGLEVAAIGTGAVSGNRCSDFAMATIDR